MGSKKKKEKQKDFKKAKLKVGKTAAKPDNYTDTSFKSKTISLPNQSITINSNSLQHELSLLKHHSSNTRKEILIQLESHLPSNSSQYKLIISSILPLIIDDSRMVRLQLVSLFKKIAIKQPGLFDLHLRSIILFIVSAMTHIQPNVRNTVSLFLEILIDYSNIKSYYNKILKNYFILMGWNLNEDKKSISLAINNNGSLNDENSKKARIEHVRILNKFLQKTMFEEKIDNGIKIDVAIHPQSYKYLLPHNVPQPYSPLKLFVNEIQENGTGVVGGSALSITDLDSISTEDLGTRMKIMNDIFKPTLVKNLKGLLKEGGDIGREANNCLKILEALPKEK
ncbi:unnamed protein product [Candida verbasci]|uniref:Pre-rRNA-processing protein n=1 Tax=Candida verbasci TaxID=1227364 RepID=A0A9W4TQR7_9ASCO|nr:unnamed protein product [Candida verbasci]